MYEEIVLLIEDQLKQLRRARALLAGPEAEQSKQPSAELANPQSVLRRKPAVQRMAAKAAPGRRGPRRLKRPTAREGAIHAMAPAGMVAVSSAEVQRREQQRREAPTTPEAIAVREGTLDALVEQLSREGKRSSAHSKATSFPFSLVDS